MLTIYRIGEGSLDFLEYDYNIHSNPSYAYKNGKLICNFDLIFQDDHSYSEKDIEFLKYIEIPIIGMPRIPKSYQTILLSKNNIEHPDTYWYSGKYSGNKLIGLLENFEDNENIFIKMNMGARGIGSVILAKKEIQRYITIDKYTEEEIKSPFLSKEVSIEDNGSARDSLQKNDVIFQKIVKPIKEYRTIFIYGEKPLLFERDISGGVGNASISGKATPLIENYDYSRLGNINDFFHTLNSPFMSFDLYESEGKHDYGVFEFQIEFGHRFIENHSYLFTQLRKGMSNLLKDRNLIQ